MTAEKGEPRVTAVKCHPELNHRDLEVISSSTALCMAFRGETVTNIKQHKKVVITLTDISLSVLIKVDMVLAINFSLDFPVLNV